MNTYTIVTTMPRANGADYLPDTLRSIEAGGFQHVQIFSEPTDEPGEGWIVSEKVQWPWPHFRAALAHALQFEPQAIAYIQDDVHVAQGLYAFVERIWDARPDDLGVLSLYLDMASTDEDAGRQKIMRDGFWKLDREHPPRGACCMVLTPEFATAILDRPMDSRMGIENRIWSICNRTDSRHAWYQYGKRSFAQHVGAVSAVCPEGRHQTPTRIASENWIRDASDMRPVELETP